MHKPNGSFRKVFAAGLAVTTAVWTLSALALVPLAQAQVEVHPAGTLVLSGGTVWKISDDGTQRMGFDSAEKFHSHRFDFADLVPANSADLALPDGGLVGWGSGVLFNDNGTVYQVAGGQKYGFTSAAVFTGLGFSFANVVAGNLSSVPSAGNIDNTTGAHKEGTLVNDNGTVWYMTATGRKGFTQPGELFSLGAGFGEVVPANAADLARANEGTMGFRTGTLVNDNGTIWAVQGSTKRGFPSASCYTGFGFSFSTPVVGTVANLSQGADFCPGGTPPPVSSTGTLTVSLASDTPASTTVVGGAARVGFTKINLTATGGDVEVDTLAIERAGVSLDANFSNFILLDVSGGTSVALASQIGLEKSLSSSHTATFTENFTVKNGTTKSILIAANMAAAASITNGDQAKIQVNSIAVTGSSSVVGSLPVAGNTMTMNGNVTIGTATIANGGQNPSATTQSVGTVDYVVSAIKVTNSSTEKIEVNSIKFTQNGSAGDSDVKDLELLVDGQVVATVSAPTNKAVIFNFPTPYVIDKGNNREFVLRVDIVSGSGRDISFDIENQADIVVRGQTFGFFILPTYPNSTSPRYNANNTTVDKGSISFSKGVLSSLNVTEGANGQVLGAFKATVQGEPVRVTQFVMGVTIAGGGNTGDVTNVVVKDPNGVVVAGPVDPDTTVAARDTATSTDTIIFPVGTTTYTIEADLNSDFSSGSTLQIDLPDPDGLTTAKGEITNNTITANPTSDLSLDTVTVKVADLNVSTSASPSAQSVIVGQSGFVFANLILSATDSGEDVRVNQVVVAHVTDADTSREDHIANLQLWNGSTALLPIVQPTNLASATTASSTFSLTNPVTVPKGQSVTLTLKGDIVGGAADDTHQFGCLSSACITAVGVSTGNTVTADVTNSNGQVMTIAANGTLTVSEDSSTPSQDFLTTGGASKLTVGELLLSANNEDLDLTDITFAVSGTNGGTLNDEVSAVYLFDGSTQIASVTPTTTGAVSFSNLDGKFTIPKGSGGKKLTVKVDTFNVTNNQGDGNVADSGDALTFSVVEDAYKAKGTSSGANIAAGSKSGTFTGKAFSVHKSIPTVAKLELTADLLNGTNPLFKFSVSADAKGDVGFYKATFSITTSTATVTAFRLYEAPNTGSEIDLTANAARGVTSVLTASSGGTGGEYSIDILFDTGTDGVGSGGEYRTITAGSSKTFELRGSVANSVAGSSVSVALLGDDGRNGTYPDNAANVDSDDKDDFIWSDLHYGNSSSTATQTIEWFNGYKVSGLASTSTTEVTNR